MGAPIGMECDLRRLILDLTGSDWAEVKPIHSVLRKSWARSLELHQKAITFSPGLARVVGVRLSALPPGDFSWSIEPIWYFLQSRCLNGEKDPDELSPALRCIFDLPEDLFPHMAHHLEEEREALAAQPSAADEIGDQEASETAFGDDDAQVGQPMPVAGQLRETLELLRRDQNVVLEGLGIR